MKKTKRLQGFAEGIFWKSHICLQIGGGVAPIKLELGCFPRIRLWGFPAFSCKISSEGQFKASLTPAFGVRSSVIVSE